jgi:hypothetical protein
MKCQAPASARAPPSSTVKPVMVQGFSTLKPVDVETLLETLCVELGFCLPPDSYDQLVESPPGDIQTFTDAVFAAEGMNPRTARRQLYMQVRNRVAATFAMASKKGV